MEPVEISAKTMEEAIALAAEQLGVPTDSLDVTVLEQAKGLFGKGMVRIRATVGAPPAKKPRKPRKSAAAPEREATTEVAAATPEPAPAEAEEPAIEATAEDSRRLCEIANEILRLSGLDAATREVGISGRYVHLELDGADVAYLIGKRGEVLNSLQYLLNTIAGTVRQTGARVVLDGQQYRTRREKVLRKLATEIADQVKARGEEAVLDALPAFERRIVHQALSEVEGVTTYSEGEEPNRRVVIAPEQ
jgi:spoIIIJ-associated protein